jgi:hypothetical protein
VPNLERRATYTAPEATKIAVRLDARDAYDQQTWQRFGPLYVDGPCTPDYVAIRDPDGVYRGWMESGCTLLGVDRRIKREAVDTATLNDDQRFYGTWDDAGLRLAWTGADWGDPPTSSGGGLGQGDGDLFIYLDTGPGGSTTAFAPYGAEGTALHMPGVTPTSTADALTADALVWVRDVETALLLRWEDATNRWAFDGPLDDAAYRFEAEVNGGQTDLYLRFDQLDLTPGGSLDLVAFATDEGTLDIWATMPSVNPLNSGRVVETAAMADRDARFALLHRYHWDSVGAGICPNGSDGSSKAYPDAEVQARLSATPYGVAYSLLDSHLFWLWEELTGERPPDVSSFLTMMSTEHSRVGANQRITYTLRYRNAGPDPATGLYAEVTAHHALRLMPGGAHGRIALGDLAGGAEATISFQGRVDVDRSPEAWAAVTVALYDDAHPSDGPPLERLWVDHQVDRAAPRFVGITQPAYVLGAGSNRIRGYVYDASPVPELTLSVADGSTETCRDATPRDGAWTCELDASGYDDGDVLNLSVEALDAFGQRSVPSAPRRLVVDTTPPTATLTSRAEPSPLLVAGTTQLTGELYDNHGLAGAELCRDGSCTSTRVQLSRAETLRTYDDDPDAPLPITGGTGGLCPGGSGIVRMFTMTDSAGSPPSTVGGVQVGFRAEHPHRDDLDVTLITPSGLSVQLLADDEVSGTAFRNYNVLLDDAAAGSYAAPHDDVVTGTAYARQGRPAAPLAAFIGQPVAGTWQLVICDTDPASNEGTYIDSDLILSPEPGRTVARRGTWAKTLRPETGLDYQTQELSVFGIDLAGNRSDDPLELNVIVDNVPPVITTTEAISRADLGQKVTLLRGTVSDGSPTSDVFIHLQMPDGEVVKRRASRKDEGWWFSMKPSVPGVHTLWVNASDPAGNVSAIEPFVVDVTCIAAQLSMAVIAEPTAEAISSVTLKAVVSNSGGDVIPAGLPIGFYVEGQHVGTASTVDSLRPRRSETVSVTWANSSSGDYTVDIVLNDRTTGVGTLPLCSGQGTARKPISILDVPLNASWNLVSSYVNPFNTRASVVQRPIEGQYVVIQSFDGGAQSYYHDLPPAVNTLQEMDAEHGYWIKTVGDQQTAMSSQETGEIQVPVLQIVGEKIAENRLIELDAGWNLVSYLPRRSQAVTRALQSIEGQYKTVLGYDEGALSYYPDLDPDFNTLDKMAPLSGYWIRMAQPGTLRYPDTLEDSMASASEGGGQHGSTQSLGAPQSAEVGGTGSWVADVRHLEREVGVTPTHSWVNIYGTARQEDGSGGSRPLPVGTAVLAVDPDGVVCGAATVTAAGRYGLLPCYGDDLTTPKDEGAQPGDAIWLMIDGQVLGMAMWTAHGERQWRPLGEVDLWHVYLPVIQRGSR